MNLKLINIYDKITFIHVQNNTTIHQIKNILSNQLNVSYKNIIFKYNDQELQDNKMIMKLNIKDNDIINYYLEIIDIRLFIVNLDKSLFQISCNSSYKIWDLKQLLIKDKSYIDKNLYYNRLILVDNNTLEYYGITYDTTIFTFEFNSIMFNDITKKKTNNL